MAEKNHNKPQTGTATAQDDESAARATSSVPEGQLSPDRILTTPFIATAVELLERCSVTGAIGLIAGQHGTGKTKALEALENRYPTLGLPGVCFRQRASECKSPTMAVRNMLSEMEVANARLHAGVGLSLDLLSRIALQEFQERHLGAILIDEAQLWTPAALGGVLSVHDYCAQKGHRFCLILAVAKSSAKSEARSAEAWIAAMPAAYSRTLDLEETSELDLELTLAVLREWDLRFAELVERVENDDGDARKAVAEIHKATRGNFRRLNYFAKLALLEKGPITHEAVKLTFTKMLDWEPT